MTSGDCMYLSRPLPVALDSTKTGSTFTKDERRAMERIIKSNLDFSLCAHLSRKKIRDGTYDRFIEKDTASNRLPPKPPPFTSQKYSAEKCLEFVPPQTMMLSGVRCTGILAKLYK